MLGMSAIHEVFSISDSTRSENLEEDNDNLSSVLSTTSTNLGTPRVSRTSSVNSTRSTRSQNLEEDDDNLSRVLSTTSTNLGSPRVSRSSSINSTQSTIKFINISKSNQSKIKNRIVCRLQYIGFSLISMGCAFAVMIIWLSRNKVEVEEVKDTIEKVKSNSTCQFWELAGDGYCDDEANTPECGYDFNDCCEAENDRSLCQNCTCFLSENKIEEYKNKNCQNYLHLMHLGNEYCDINYNKEEYFFDVGDCCLDLNIEKGCKYKDKNTGAEESIYCPENPCIKSNNFCIPEELGDGLCQDHNNGPFCEYDMGDCCLPSDQSIQDCCNCDCTWKT